MWLLAFFLIAADSSSPDAWGGRAEAAAVRLREASNALAETANGVAGDGRIGSLAVLRDQVDEVVRRANVLSQIAAAPSTPPERPKPPTTAPGPRRPGRR